MNRTDTLSVDLTVRVPFQIRMNLTPGSNSLRKFCVKVTSVKIGPDFGHKFYQLVLLERPFKRSNASRRNTSVKNTRQKENSSK